jgi:hypothetical protein
MVGPSSCGCAGRSTTSGHCDHHRPSGACSAGLYASTRGCRASRARPGFVRRPRADCSAPSPESAPRAAAAVVHDGAFASARRPENASRCQRITVAGVTTSSTLRHVGDHRLANAMIKRCHGDHRTRPESFRRATMSCWQRVLGDQRRATANRVARHAQEEGHEREHPTPTIPPPPSRPDFVASTVAADDPVASSAFAVVWSKTKPSCSQTARHRARKSNPPRRAAPSCHPPRASSVVPSCASTLRWSRSPSRKTQTPM